MSARHGPDGAARDVITKAPLIIGHFGRAWGLGMVKQRARANRPDAAAFLVAFVIEAPRAHPIWHSYVLSLGHLRPIEGAAPTRFYLPGATHEIVLMTLDPLHPRQPVIAGDAGFHVLLPPNFASQMIYSSDDAAYDAVIDTVIDICDGRLSPDTDATQQWAQRFGDCMLRHVRFGDCMLRHVQ